MNLSGKQTADFKKIKRKTNALHSKITIGGSVGSFAMNKLKNRDFEMNAEAYKAVAEEQRLIRLKKLSTCAKCGARKTINRFRNCYKCFKNSN